MYSTGRPAGGRHQGGTPSMFTFDGVQNHRSGFTATS